jgi:hypothetical protein
MNYRRQSHKSLGHAHYRLGALRRRIGEVRAEEIDTLFLHRYVTRRQEEGCEPATINWELAAIRRALNLAAEDAIVREVPRFRHLRKDIARQGFFERYEVSWFGLSTRPYSVCVADWLAEGRDSQFDMKACRFERLCDQARYLKKQPWPSSRSGR